MLALTSAAIIAILFPGITVIVDVCTVEGIGDLPGGYVEDPAQVTFSSISDISGDGVRAVGYGTQATLTGVEEAKAGIGWTKKSGKDPFLPGGSPGLVALPYCDTSGPTVDAFASGISFVGKTVVGYATCSGIQTPMIWENGVPTPLGLPPYASKTGQASKASLVSEVIVGWVSPMKNFADERTPRFPMAWRTATRQPVGLVHEMPGSSANGGEAFDVSKSGKSIVGTIFDTSQGRFTSPYPVCWRPLPGNDLELNILQGPTATDERGTATAISADGMIAVGCIGTYPNTRACRWVRSSEFVKFGNAEIFELLPGDEASTATALRGDGFFVVGVSRRGDNLRPFIWDQNQKTRDLTAILAVSTKTPLTDWRLEQPTAMSEDGKVIAGAGIHNGSPEGWVYYCEKEKIRVTLKNYFFPPTPNPWWKVGPPADERLRS